MDWEEKIALLTEGAKYDVSCSSSGTVRSNGDGGLGNAVKAGICHSWAADGRCISLLKILLSNNCAYDCRYCRIRRSNDIPRATLSVSELVDLTLNFYRRNYIEGLFLSSAVLGDPSKTMELMLRVVKALRKDHGFNGYIHLKAIPGASEAVLAEAGLYADRMSVNMELPSEESLKQLAPQKERKAILQPMALMGGWSHQYAEDRKNLPAVTTVPRFLPAGQTTQMIIGASAETDRQIISLTGALYRKFELKRVYYSAYVPVNQDLPLPVPLSAQPAVPPLLREHRLYQADWLMRFYQFEAEEILEDTAPFLDSVLDPKAAWAARHPEFFPLEVNRASYQELLRVPGIGVNGALRIIRARRTASLDFPHLKRMGIVLKRARHFILCRGRSYQHIEVGGAFLRERLLREAGFDPARQLELFEPRGLPDAP
jgi:putative DNA modification/repair radical SAM protein